MTHATRKVLVVFGTRPEAIKMAPVVHALQSQASIETILCVTAQHRQMLDQVLELFELTPDIDLDIMKPGQDLADITSRVLLGLRDTLASVQPSAVLVHGDTSTALASTMAAFYSGIPVGHVEAGLRTYDMQAPFPEEFNRQVISKIAHWHFAPTEKSRANLLAEAVAPAKIIVTGNTVIDALLWTLARTNKRQANDAVTEQIDQLIPFAWQKTPFLLMTGHRRENFGLGFIHICDAIRALATKYPDLPVIYPVHLNPQVQEPVLSRLGDLPNVHLIAPLDYEPFALLLKHCHLVLTDSGGIQEEAPSLGKPVLVMRDTTERPEAIEAGTVKLVGTDTQAIVSAVSELLGDPAHYLAMSEAHNPYGDGHAAKRIAQVIANWDGSS
ncbi:MAG: UDP-N-acetylglucosamine 2-epimerase (non-hydrolyzing) [Orrella sp.]